MTKCFYAGQMDYGTIWGIILFGWMIQILRRRYLTHEYWAISLKIYKIRDYGKEKQADPA